MVDTSDTQGARLWLELPPISEAAPRRLLVFLHGAGSSADAFAPIAIAWQLKFPGATVAILDAPRPSCTGPGSDWYDARGLSSNHRGRIAESADEVARRIEALQEACELNASSTVLIGFSQGATVALELARRSPERIANVVSYAGRLASPVREGEAIMPTIHLIHGELDSLVPAAHSRRAHRHLSAAGADVTLDVVVDETHDLGQALVTLGATRVLQTVFRDRRRDRPLLSTPGTWKLQ